MPKATSASIAALSLAAMIATAAPASAAPVALTCDPAISGLTNLFLEVTTSADGADTTVGQARPLGPLTVVLSGENAETIGETIAEPATGLLELVVTEPDGTSNGLSLPIDSAVTASGPGMTEYTWNAVSVPPYTSETAGVYTFAATGITLEPQDPDEDNPAICSTSVDAQVLEWNAVTTPPAPTPTTAPTAAPSPVRPAVVRTDAAQGSPTSASWALIGAALAACTAAGGALFAARRRQH